MMPLSIDFANLHTILATLYDEMLPLCEDMMDVGKGLAGLGALFYVAVRVWQSMARAEPIDVYPLLRPFAIGICILLFPTLVLGTLNNILSPIVQGTHKMLEGQTMDMEQYRIQKEELEKEAMLRNPETAYLVSDEEFDRQLDELGWSTIDTASRLGMYVEVGAFLSGGVDSGYLASASGADQAFTVGFDEGDRYSEVNKAAKVAEKSGLKHHVKIISKQEFWDALPDVMYHMDEPLGDASAVALYFLSKEAAGHVKVVLSGEGADELFGGYNIYREPEALKKVAWIPFVLRRAVRKLAAKLPDVKGRDFLIRAGMKVEERFIGNAYIYCEKEKAQILKNKVTGPSTQ